MFDPFGFHNSMMRNFMLDPFGQQQQAQQQRNGGGNGGRNSQQLAIRDPFGMMMSSSSSPFERHHQMMMRSDPFAMMNSMMGNMGGMFRNMDQFTTNSDPNSQVYSSSSVISYSSSGDGRPKIYQESKQVRHGPGGVKETREMVRDTSKGIEKVAIGHHIGERAHIIERQKLDDGAMEEIVNLENLDEEEVQEFNKEFETKIAPHARSFNTHGNHNHHNHHHRSLHLNNNHPLAIEGSAAKKEKERKSKSKSSKN